MTVQQQATFITEAVRDGDRLGLATEIPASGLQVASSSGQVYIGVTSGTVAIKGTYGGTSIDLVTGLTTGGYLYASQNLSLTVTGGTATWAPVETNPSAVGAANLVESSLRIDPTSAQTGVSTPLEFNVYIRDQFGVDMPTGSATVDFTPDGGPTSWAPGASVPTVAGVATSTITHTVAAGNTSAVGDDPVQINVSATGLGVATAILQVGDTAVATALNLQPAGNSTEIDVAVILQVEALDQYGNLISDTTTMTFASDDPDGVFSVNNAPLVAGVLQSFYTPTGAGVGDHNITVDGGSLTQGTAVITVSAPVAAVPADPVLSGDWSA